MPSSLCASGSLQNRSPSHRVCLPCPREGGTAHRGLLPWPPVLQQQLLYIPLLLPPEKHIASETASPCILPDPVASSIPCPQKGSRERPQAKPSSPQGPVSLPRQATAADPPGPPLPPSSSCLLSGSSISRLNLGAESAKAFSLSFGDFSFTTQSVGMMLNAQIRWPWEPRRMVLPDGLERLMGGGAQRDPQE